MLFSKPPTSIEKQITLLRERGLVVPDEKQASHYLQFIGYYRFSGYALVFQVNRNADKLHRFLPNTHFDEILDLYIFDRKLRRVVLDALERIEVAFRSTISHEMSIQHGAHWFQNASHFTPNYNHAHFLEHLKKEIKHDPSGASARQIFIQHYYEKYGNPDLPPSWMVFEVLSFGTVSQVFKRLKRENQKRIARLFGLDAGVLASWIHSISYLRNLAAHHQRLWNRTFTIKPIVAKHYANDLKNAAKFYSQAAITQILLRTIEPKCQWSRDLTQLITEHPNINIQSMGFPGDWEKRDIWSDQKPIF